MGESTIGYWSRGGRGMGGNGGQLFIPVMSHDNGKKLNTLHPYIIFKV